ncbi:HAMP domain-containing sensor histidine kinase [Agrococcus sp. SCSIO52902]|uniref:sensor histidine kinase n=1 Tax=Agrococcus sp. SCSIO52902 TaxID=2933290 RepID=UPI001FF132E8|nr:HAMP domain-containing sensor histidine kinase [Agrococcus sp. SCSIO52902]UOW01537.1 HAMP domain-containing histidine kinase [Agrococcus sp. SCSIO52902]
MAERAAPEPRPRRRASIRLRITAAAVAVVAVALGLGATALVWTLERMLQASVGEQLADELDALAQGVDEGTIQTAALVQRDDDVLVALRSTSGVVVNADAAAELPVPTGREPLTATVAGERYVVVAADAAGGTIVVARSLATIDDAVRSSTALLAVAVPLAVILVATVVWIVVDRALSHVDRMRAQVDEIDAAGLDRRVETTSRGDELDRLATTMNRMLARVEADALSRQRFVSDASHELRSPLASMRQFAELSRTHPDAVAPGELSEVVLHEGERMHGIVEALLLLARLDEHAAGQRQAVDLDDLAHEEVARVRALGRAVDGTAVRAAPVVGDARLLGRACRNLVDNALRHARGRVALGSVVRDGRAMLWVDDDGAGVPEGERDRVFERFVRLDEGRARDDGGSGLGLAIVRQVARAHGGDAWVTSAPAGGARFVIELPAAPAARDEPGS